MSDGAFVSAWWASEPRVDADLSTGQVTVHDQGPEISLAGTQVALLAVACIYERFGLEGLDRHPALEELRGYVPVRAR